MKAAFRIIATSFSALALSGACFAGEAAPVAPTLKLERAVMIMRHAVRAPLDGEVPDKTVTAKPWPKWAVANEVITDRGIAAYKILARYDRHWLLPDLSSACPAPGTVRIWTNTSSRTIDSGKAYAEGFAPGCGIAIGHLKDGQTDPLFESLSAHATAFDPAKAIAAINRYTGGMAALVARHEGDIEVLDQVLGCREGHDCARDGAAALAPSADGHGIDLSGPIRSTSGIAEVLLLQYAEGMPMDQVGWGKLDPATIKRLGRLHKALFDVFTRPDYMAAHQAAALGDHMLRTLADPAGPKLEILVGHDTNVNALAAALQVDLDAPGYAYNDAAPGGALVMTLLRDTMTGERFVRLFYRTQSLDAIRALSPEVEAIPLAVPGCPTRSDTPCSVEQFSRILRARLAPLK